MSDNGKGPGVLSLIAETIKAPIETGAQRVFREINEIGITVGDVELMMWDLAFAMRDHTEAHSQSGAT